MRIRNSVGSAPLVTNLIFVHSFLGGKDTVSLNGLIYRSIFRFKLVDEMTYKFSLMENEKGGHLNGVDKARNIAELRIQGMTNEDICAIYSIGEKQLKRYQKVEKFPDVLKTAVANESILTSHGLLLMQAYERNREAFNLVDWINRIIKDQLSVRQLQREINKVFGMPKKKVRYLEKKGKGFRLYPMKFDPKRTDDATKEKMKEKLKQALALLES